MLPEVPDKDVHVSFRGLDFSLSRKIKDKNYLAQGTLQLMDVSHKEMGTVTENESALIECNTDDPIATLEIMCPSSETIFSPGRDGVVAI